MTGRLALTYGGFTYLDRTWALMTGEVQPEGIDLSYAAIPEIGALFRRQAQFAEFDVSEMSTSTLMMMYTQGRTDLVGLPVFPSRTFRHAFIFVREDSDIHEPKDFVGKRIGVQDYQATAYVWLRALLEHEFGVTPRDVTWYVGGLDVTTQLDRLRHEPPPGVDIRVLKGTTLEEALRAGDLDVVMTPEDLVSTSATPPNWRRLWPDYQEREREYYARTGFFPIMHCVAMRRDVYEADPWIAKSLLDAFETAKQWGYRRLRDLSAPAVGIPGLRAALRDLDEVFGGDAFPYGFEANRPILTAMAQYSHEQGLATRMIDPAEIFAPDVVDHTPRSLL
jgi:4,5-dihydroxyphthalate decarboxylase